MRTVHSTCEQKSALGLTGLEAAVLAPSCGIYILELGETGIPWAAAVYIQRSNSLLSLTSQQQTMCDNEYESGIQNS